MSKSKKIPYSAGIQIPGSVAKVKTAKTAKEPKPNKFGIRCKKGVICAKGIAIPPAAGINLLRVHARVYRLNQPVPSPNTPPTDAMSRVVNTNGHLDWHFDDIPNAQCAGGGGDADNKLCLWCVWDQGNPTPDKQEFSGICGNKTDCER